MLNTIVYVDQLQAGVSQAHFIQATHQLGFDAIEVRDEYLRDDAECLQIAESADASSLDVFYSVNDALFRDGQPTDVLHYVERAGLLHASHIKFNLGALAEYQGALKSDFEDLLDLNIQVNVENNQTIAESSLADFQQFFTMTDEQEVPIGFCFDVANWAWLQVPLDMAIKALASRTQYLHLKNYVAAADKRLSVVPLTAGQLNIADIVVQFAPDIPMALEYPGHSDALSGDLALLRSF